MLLDNVPLEKREQYEKDRQKIKSVMLQHSEADQNRIKRMAVAMIGACVVSGEIEETPQAIALAMPQAMLDAIQTMNAVNEFVS